MPVWWWRRTVSWSFKLHHLSLRAIPLQQGNVSHGMWVRVRNNASLVQQLCEPGDEEDGGAAGAPLVGPPRSFVGWNAGMRGIIGCCYAVCGEVDVTSWDTPVVGLRVKRGWACISPAFGAPHECRAPCVGGWFLPLAALERI
jgi:hypothetical protein